MITVNSDFFCTKIPPIFGGFPLQRLVIFPIFNPFSPILKSRKFYVRVNKVQTESESTTHSGKHRMIVRKQMFFVSILKCFTVQSIMLRSFKRKIQLGFLKSVCFSKKTLLNLPLKVKVQYLAQFQIASEVQSEDFDYGLNISLTRPNTV
jgi:hypothetical protein